MPTFNRRRFVSQAIKYFLEQDYPAKELIIIDDGTDIVKDIVPHDPIINYYQLQKKMTIGAKRNLAIEKSQGEIILHWDDDDWHARHRIRYQAEQLLSKRATICGNNKMLFYDTRTQELWLYEFPIQRKVWLAGGSLCFTRSFWRQRQFDDTSYGEDTYFLWKKPLDSAYILPDFKFYIAMIHSANTCPKSLSSHYWKKWYCDNFENLTLDDSTFYRKFRTT